MSGITHEFLVEFVLDWEGNGGSVEELEAGVHHKTIIIIEEESPEPDHPAGGDGSNSVLVDEPVPQVGGEVLNDSHFVVIFKNYIRADQFAI